jgi:predicted AlkP superfamily phosphohydrolase/phosphomutase/tetratricopeptide (TPR) repeat protein
MATRLAQRVLLLGWDAADWQLIQPLLDAGRMPHLERLITEGVMGNLATLQPILSPMLWTSMATGKPADQHGVHGCVEPRPDGLGVRPVASTSVRAHTLWRILTNHGLQSAVVGWHATHPAERVGGTAVSNYYQHAAGQEFDDWPLPSGVVAPETLRDIMHDLRVHPTDLSLDQLRFFVPEVAHLDQEQDQRLARLAQYLAECATVHAAGTYLAEHTSWDLLAIYFDTIDRLCHEFTVYRAPQRPEVSDADFALYSDVVDRCYEYHDLMLGRYIRLVGPQTTIFIVSAQGFFSDCWQPHSHHGAHWANPVSCHRSLGILVAHGPGLQRDELVFGASLLDVTPTILTLLGLPVGQDMAGRALTQMFDHPVTPEMIATYETAASRGPLAEIPEDDPWAAQEAIKQLVALGYIEPAAKATSQAVAQATLQKLYTLAEVHLSQGAWEPAAALLTEIVQRHDTHVLARLRLAQCRLHLGDVAGARTLVDAVCADRPEAPWASVAYGLIAFAQQHWDEALACFERAATAAPALPQIQYRMGVIYLRQQHWEAAETAFRRALAIDGESAPTYDGLGVALYQQQQYAEAAEHLLCSVRLLYHQPLVHYHLGIVFAAQGQLTLAGKSLHTALEMQPDFAEARACLATVSQARDAATLARVQTKRTRSRR